MFCFLIRNLKTVDDISETFTQCENALSTLFGKYMNIPNRHIESHIKFDYLTILHVILTPAQQGSMYRKLREKFTESTGSIVSNVSKIAYILCSVFYFIFFQIISLFSTKIFCGKCLFRNGV